MSTMMMRGTGTMGHQNGDDEENTAQVTANERYETAPVHPHHHCEPLLMGGNELEDNSNPVCCHEQLLAGWK